MNDQNENGRRIHHWRGKNRKEDVAELADAIVASGVELYNDKGTIFQLGPAGELTSVGQNKFRTLIDQHIAAVRVVNRGTKDKPNYQRELYTYAFAQRPRFIPTMKTPHQDPKYELEPDDRALVEVFEELPSRSPRVVDRE
jgi:hypothetical protein